MDVLVTVPLPEKLLSRIERHHTVTLHNEDSPISRGALETLIQGKAGLLCTITDKVDGELLQRADQLRVVANYGVGYDNIDVEACTAKGILVTNTPGVLTEATADLTMALILAVARRLLEGDQMVRQGRFKAWTPFGFLGREVSGKTLGIIGLGRIGRAVAKRANAFSMKVIYYSRTRLPGDQEHALQVDYTDLEGLLKESDFVSIHVPLTDGTRHMIGREEFSLMKRTAYLINTSRGAVVDEEALAEALKSGRIAGAGLDVYEHEPKVHEALLEMKNTVLLPHIGSATVETRTRMGELAVENLLAGLDNKRPPTCLNWDAVKAKVA